MHRLRYAAIPLAAPILVACGLVSVADSDVFTLYRNSVVDVNMRIHVASFDSSDGEAYNRENCDLARTLFQAQPSVQTKFWCEKGRFRK